MKKLILIVMLLTPVNAHALAAEVWFRCRNRLIYVQELNRSCVQLVNYYHTQQTGVPLFSSIPKVHNPKNDPKSLPGSEWAKHATACEAGRAMNTAEFFNCKSILESLVKGQ